MGQMTVEDFFNKADSEGGIVDLFDWGFDPDDLADDVPEDFRDVINYLHSLIQDLDNAVHELLEWDSM